jgi:DNA-binding transcriptional MocR family regulator
MCGEALKWAHTVQGLKPGEKALLVQLAYLLRPGTKLIATYEQLAKRLGVSLSSICRYLKLLENRQLIDRRPVKELGKLHLREILLHHRNDMPVRTVKGTSKCLGNPRQFEAPIIEDKYTPYNPPLAGSQRLDYFEQTELWVTCYRLRHNGADAETAEAAAMVSPIRHFKNSIVAAAEIKLKRRAA